MRQYLRTHIRMRQYLRTHICMRQYMRTHICRYQTVVSMKRRIKNRYNLQAELPFPVTHSHIT